MQPWGVGSRPWSWQHSARVRPLGHRLINTKSMGKNNDEKKVIFVFRNPGPVSNCIPRYLSAVITKCLRQISVDMEDRAMARYVSMNVPATSNAAIGRSLHGQILQSPQFEMNSSGPACAGPFCRQSQWHSRHTHCIVVFVAT